jgi:hypothetical protein
MWLRFNADIYSATQSKVQDLDPRMSLNDPMSVTWHYILLCSRCLHGKLSVSRLRHCQLPKSSHVNGGFHYENCLGCKIILDSLTLCTGTDSPTFHSRVDPPVNDHPKTYEKKIYSLVHASIQIFLSRAKILDQCSVKPPQWKLWMTSQRGNPNTEQWDHARYTRLDSQFSLISDVQLYEEVNSNPTCLIPSTPDFTVHRNRVCDIVLLEPDGVDQWCGIITQRLHFPSLQFDCHKQYHTKFM